MSDEYQKMDDMTPYELVLLAMKAFLYVNDNKPQVTDDILLKDILSWFMLMTDDIDLIEIEDVTLDRPTDKGLH